MTRTSTRGTRWTSTLSGVLLLGTEVSAFYLTLSNFQPVPTLSLSLECIFAYNTPMEGCAAEEFGMDGACSSSCRRGLATIQSNIQEACAMASAGRWSLLEEARDGSLVAALCRNAQSAPEPPSTPDDAPLRTFMTMAPDPTAAVTTTTTTTTTTTQGNHLPDGPTRADTSASESTARRISTRMKAGDDADGTRRATTSEPRSTAFRTGHDTAAPTTTSEPRSTAFRTGRDTAAPTTTSRTWTTLDAAQTQRRGGGGSPFDPVPDSAARLGRGTVSLFAVGSCIIGTYVLL